VPARTPPTTSAAAPPNPPPQPPSFYAALSAPVDARFVRIRFVGKNHEPIWAGEAVLGQALSLEQRPLWCVFR
jgi:hypothetical protein